MGILCGMLAIWTDHRRKMALIEKGLWKPEYERARPETALGFGLFLSAIGAALLVGSFWGSGR